MEPFDRNKKRKNPFDDFFNNMNDDDFERIFEEARKMIEDMFKDGTPFQEMGQGKPFIHGFKINVGPDGNPDVTEFGNRTLKNQDGRPAISEEREPLTDVIEGEKDVAITVEIPGVEKDDIDLNATEAELEITVDNPDRKYHKVIDLPCDVKPKTTKATYKNGILDVVIQRKEAKKDDSGFKVNIE